MKNLGFILGALLLVTESHAAVGLLEKGIKIQCVSETNKDEPITVEFKKELKSEGFLQSKYAVTVSQPGNKSLGFAVKPITSILYSSSIQTRTMAGAHYQVVIHAGRILFLTDLRYSVFEDSNPVGFYGKLINLKYGGYSETVNCQFVQ